LQQLVNKMPNKKHV
jgi:hypothetical protein